MTRDQLLVLVRSLYRLTPSQMARVEDFIQALDPELTSARLEAVWLYIAAIMLEARQDREADTG